MIEFSEVLLIQEDVEEKKSVSEIRASAGDRQTKFSFPSCSSQLINFTLTYSHRDQQRETISGEGLTADGGPLRQDGDGSHRGVLQVLDGTVFGAPAVGADPQEMTHLVRSLTGVQDAPV